MDFSSLVKQRYSVRAYKPEKVEDEKLQKILEAAVLAPTAANKQPFQVVVIHTSGREEELKKIYGKDWFVQAPLVLAVCSLNDQSWVRRQDNKDYAYVDAAIVMDHIIMAATEEGLGTCWIAAFEPQAARDLLGLPDNVDPVVFTPLGYPADSARPKKRKTMDDLVRYERW